MWKKMNVPNKITMLRIILVPFFVIAMCLPSQWEVAKFVALGIYVFAAFTDFVDGYISRKKNIVTKFGKIMDPLADKLLVSAGFIMLTGVGIIPAWITVIMIFRDFFVSSLRVFGADKGKDVSAALSGKVKTVFQLVGVPLAILGFALFENSYFGSFVANATFMPPFELLLNISMTVAISAAAISTIWSFVEYFNKFKADIDVQK